MFDEKSGVWTRLQEQEYYHAEFCIYAQTYDFVTPDNKIIHQTFILYASII